LQHSLRVNAATVGYFVTSLFIARPKEIKVKEKVMETLSLLIVYIAEKLFMLKQIASSKT
jgi:hypothetical protein